MSTRPTLLKLFLENNEDDELTCILCNQGACDQLFVTRGHGIASIKGVHSKCAQKNNDRMTKTKES